MLGLLESVDNRPLQVAHAHFLLLGRPVVSEPEEVLVPAANEPEFHALRGQGSPGLQGADYDYQLGLGRHAVDLHGGGVREVVVLPVHDLPGDDERVSQVVPLPSQLEGDQDVETGLEPGRHTPIHELAGEAPRGGFGETRDVPDILEAENSTAPFVERRQQLRRLGPQGLERCTVHWHFVPFRDTFSVEARTPSSGNYLLTFVRAP